MEFQPQYNTNLLRFFAISLIINSHLDTLLPASYSRFATGGMIGNSLFFMLSSLGLFLSYKKSSKTFIEWYTQRILRIYPSLWVVLTFILLPICLYDIEVSRWMCDNSIQAFLQYYFLPKAPFWFLQAIMIYYIMVYFIIKYYSDKLMFILSILLLMIYLYFYLFQLDLNRFSMESYPFKLIFYASVTLFGIFLGSKNNTIVSNGFRDIVMVLLCVLGIYYHKFLMYNNHFEYLQFSQHVLVFPLLYFLLKFSKIHFIYDRIFSKPILAKSINFCSNLTLEIYLVHSSISIFFEKLKFTFPINVILFVSISLIISVLVKIIARRISNFLVNA